VYMNSGTGKHRKDPSSLRIGTLNH